MEQIGQYAEGCWNELKNQLPPKVVVNVALTVIAVLGCAFLGGYGNTAGSKMADRHF